MDISVTGPRRLLKIVIEHVSSSHEHIIDMLEGLQSLLYHREIRHIIDMLEGLRNSSDIGCIKEIRESFQKLASLEQELKVFFRVPKQQILSNLTPTLNSNEIVAVFVNFLMLMVEVILHFEEYSIARVKGSFQNLRTELGFLISFLGDTAMHLQPTKTILIDIEDVVNEVGNFLYSFLLAIVVFMLIGNAKGAYIDRMPDLEVVVNELRSLFHSDFIHLPLRSTKVKGKMGRKGRKKQKKKAIMNIIALLIESGSLLDFLIFAKNDQVMETGILDLALSDLLAKFETLKTKIKEHCITVSKMPSDMAPKIGVVSLFIIDSVLDDLMDLINNKSDSIVAVNDQIVTLHEELMLLGSSITDIALQHEAEHEELVIRSRDIAYEVEYVINSFPYVWYLTLRLPQLIEKTQLITMSVKEMKNSIDVAKMSSVSKYPHEHVESQPKEPPILEDIVVGFDNVTIEIAEQLIGGTDRLQIISIFGMPGLGKTTLANKLYNDPSVILRFDKRAWCVVSQIYNKKNVLIEILSSVGNEKRDTYMKNDEESLVEDLYKNLKGWRFLIVIDDIWDVNVWTDLKRCFPDDGIGSRILFTTRNKEVGLKASTCSVVKELPFLSEVECWEILQEKVFQDKKCPQQLLDIGKLIAKNCHGLPLAVVVIAGVLANVEKKKHLWEKIARNLSSHISEIPEKCIQILQLSYKHLPMHLKPCFLYFGAFKEDMGIPARELISLWVAEGFIKKEEQKNIEDVAREYLMKLIDRSLVLVAERSSYGGVKTCKIHDLLREMCLRIAEENNFLKLIKGNDDCDRRLFNQPSAYQKHHYLSINCASYPSSLPFGLHVRSLLCDCYFEVFGSLISWDYKVLRVFSVRSLDYCPNGVEHMVHLRYLAIPGTRPLPPMESFHKLEFLVVRYGGEVEIPEILLNMVSLRHMEFKGGAYFSESSRQLATNSESFQINNNLQSISTLSIYNKMDEKILRRFSPNLRKLKVGGDSLNCSLDFLNQLESLRLNGRHISYSNSNSNSHSFYFSSRSFYFSFSSCSISLPLNLKKLRLENVEASRKQMEIIGRLPYLEVLKLAFVALEGYQWDTSEGEFPQLKHLMLRSVKLVEWNASDDSFRRLQRIVLKYCKDLKMIPSSFGESPTLQKIQLDDCGQTANESAKKIKEEQKEMGNEWLEVTISGTFSEESDSK